MLLVMKRTPVQGQADVNEYRVSSKVPGRVLRYLVKEGDPVKAGDTLAILEAPEVNAKLKQARAVEQAAAATQKTRKAEKGARSGQMSWCLRNVAKGACWCTDYPKSLMIAFKASLRSGSYDSPKPTK